MHDNFKLPPPKNQPPAKHYAVCNCQSCRAGADAALPFSVINSAGTMVPVTEQLLEQSVRVLRPPCECRPVDRAVERRQRGQFVRESARPAPTWRRTHRW